MTHVTCADCGEGFETQAEHDRHHEMAHAGQKGGVVEEIGDKVDDVGEAAEETWEDVKDKVD